MLEVGDRAPQFTLPDQDGTKVALKDLKGTPVVVYFYPKDDTPGCTTQACDIRDQWSEFEEAGAVVLGISPDDVDSHARFSAKYDLPHRLLADPDRTVIQKYGAWGVKKMYGKEYEGVIRSTVLVGPTGKVAAVWPKIQPKKHADAVLKAIRGLQED
ncbi:MAG: thioredoxin-dependent thiol peroxidase [Nitriliruptoraceae bacterium]|nr:thioredoxin-dependent thiol peroxidase [Nitriliruptoraceae bacterium]